MAVAAEAMAIFFAIHHHLVVCISQTLSTHYFPSSCNDLKPEL